MALYYSKGTISEMTEVQSGTSKNGYEWQRMSIVLDVPGFQGSVTKQCFQVTGDDVNDVLLYNIGDKVEVAWSLYAREWNGKWYNNVELVKISHQVQPGQVHPVSAPATPKTQQIQFDQDNPEADLPF